MEQHKNIQTTNSSHLGLIYYVVYAIIKHIGKRLTQLIKLCVYCLKALFLMAILINPDMGFGQNLITLEQCHASSDSLFPIAKQTKHVNAINSLEIKNLSSAYLPTIDLNIKATYQSKVTSIDMSAGMPGFESPTVPHEQYGATVDIKQIIYDGGAIKSAKNLQQEKLASELQQIEVDQFKIKEQINELYMLSFFIQENLEIISLAKQTIKEQKKVLKASVENGLINASELYNLEAELLKLDQQEIELFSSKNQILNALSELSCLSINEQYKLQMPIINLPSELQVYRPEHKLFSSKSKIIDASINASSTQRKPKVFAFGSAGAGYPGLNMFSNAFEPYVIVGAQINWNIWDWKQTKRNSQKLNLQKQLIYNQQEVFDKNISIQLNKALLNKEKLERLISKDAEIIELRESISKRSASQLENGSITSAMYLMDLNAEKQAKIALKQHQIQLTQTKLNILSITGKSFTNN